MPQMCIVIVVKHLIQSLKNLLNEHFFLTTHYQSWAVRGRGAQQP